MCWIDWKINLRIFIFRVIVKIHRKLSCFLYKNYHNSKNKKSKKSEIRFFFLFSTFRIFHVSLTTFEKKNYCNACRTMKRLLMLPIPTRVPEKKIHVWLNIEKINKFYILFSKVFKFTWKMRNMLNRKKKKISDFSHFYFSSYGHFCTPIFDELFTITRKIKSGKIIFHSIQHIARLP